MKHLLDQEDVKGFMSNGGSGNSDGGADSGPDACVGCQTDFWHPSYPYLY